MCVGKIDKVTFGGAKLLKIYPTKTHLSRTMISLWLKALRIHGWKPKNKIKYGDEG